MHFEAQLLAPRFPRGHFLLARDPGASIPASGAQGAASRDGHRRALPGVMCAELTTRTHFRASARFRGPVALPYTRRVRRFPIRPLPCAALLVLLLGSCATTEAKVWNLEQLHDGDTRHRYSAAIQSDFGFLIRHQFLGLFQGAGAQFVAEKDLEPVEDPAGECLYNLIELQERARDDDELDPRHVEWFARVAVEDTSRLSRERAVLALAEFGGRLPIGLPARLGADQQPAGPEVLAPVLEELVRAVRGLVEKRADAPAEIAARGAAVRALDLDLAAGRRALRASTELQRLAATGDVRAPELDELVLHLESLCIRRALAAAIEDKDDLVRAAAVRGVARTGGARAFDVVLYDRLRKEKATLPLRTLLEVLAETGLPKPDGGATPIHTTEDWIGSIHVIAIQHPQGELRVRAMQTLQVVAAPELQSLREEDWYAWWLARRAAQQPGAQPAAVPATSATVPSGLSGARTSTALGTASTTAAPPP